MAKLTKNQKLAAEKIEAGKLYTVAEAAALVKEITTTKFDASVDIDVRLGVDPRKANQMVRGVVSLPNGTGKEVRVLALCTPDQEAAAKEAGADYVGLDEYIEKIKGGWTDIDVRLGVDPRKANQMVRGVVTLPHGTGKTVRVLVLCTPEKEAEAQAAGADYVGLDEYIEKIKGGWTDVDVIITTPNVMGKVGALGRILGPRGLMPNPKTGTVTMDVAKAVQEVKAGKIDFKVDKYGIIHTSIGKVSFTPEQIVDNAHEVMSTIIKLKPSAAKGTYVKSIFLSTTMSPGIEVDPKSVENK